jgi:beta-phosphoglucomutase-like phosphatase (HAD superfamily)
MTKADPQIYVEAAKRLGERVEDVTFLDDNLGACRTAKVAGMKVYGVYDDSSAEYTKEMSTEFDGYIVKFSELI